MNSFLKVILNLFRFFWSYLCNFQIIYRKWGWHTSKSNFWCLGNLRLTAVSILRKYAILSSFTKFFFQNIFYFFIALISTKSLLNIIMLWLVLFTDNLWSLGNSKRRLRHPGHALGNILESTRILKVRKKWFIISWRLGLGFFLIMRGAHDVFFR
jgi:hypothetical protein